MVFDITGNFARARHCTVPTSNSKVIPGVQCLWGKKEMELDNVFSYFFLVLTEKNVISSFDDVK